MIPRRSGAPSYQGRAKQTTGAKRGIDRKGASRASNVSKPTHFNKARLEKNFSRKKYILDVHFKAGRQKGHQWKNLQWILYLNQ